MNHPQFQSQMVCDVKKNLKANILGHWTQIVAGINYRFHVEVVIKTGPKCDKKRKLSCQNLTVHRPLPGKCYQKLGQKPKKIRKGNSWVLPMTTACDTLAYISELACYITGGRISKKLYASWD